MKVSMKQISEETGFSTATVCNALKHKYGVNPATAEKILKKADELGYKANSREVSIGRVRLLILKKTGLIIDNSPFFPSLIEGVEQQSKTMGMEILLTTLSMNAPDYERRMEEILRDASTALIVLGTELEENDYRCFTKAVCPIIILDSASRTYPFDSVQINNEETVASVVQYLLDRGHPKIGFIRGSIRIKAFLERSKGLRGALAAAGLKAEPIITVGTTTETAYSDMVKYLQTRPKLPTAFFADDDAIALGAMRALKENGVHIPKDVSLIGFDDLAFGEISSPRLTTVHVFKEEMGRMAVRRMFDHINLGSTINAKILVYTNFIERDSVRDLRENTTR